MATIDIEKILQKKEKQGLLRTLKPVALRKRGKVLINNKEYIDFSSNDYLGLSEHPKLKEAVREAVERFGTASCASRLMSGDLELHHFLEERTAQFKQKDAALVFNSGYQANVGIISSLYGKGDIIFADRLVHASIIDGIVLSRVSFFRFQHNDTSHLEDLLKRERAKFKQALIVTESIFSMDGDRAPLEALVNLKEKYNCQILVDEAHATGVFGKNGSGVVEEESLSDRIDFIMGTFSKALAGFGAYLAASQRTIQYLISACRSFIYSTALPPAIIAQNLAAIELVAAEPFRRENLLEASRFLREDLRKKGFQVKGDSQILPVIIGDNSRAVALAKALQKKGFWVLPIRTPTVPVGGERLRFSLTFYHTQEVLQRLSHEIRKIRV